MFVSSGTKKLSLCPPRPRTVLVVGCEIQHLKVAHIISSDNELMASPDLF